MRVVDLDGSHIHIAAAAECDLDKRGDIDSAGKMFFGFAMLIRSATPGDASLRARDDRGVLLNRSTPKTWRSLTCSRFCS